jgi:predicted dehydrogenase
MKVAVIGTGFGKAAMAPAYAKLGFEVEVVSPRDPEAVERALVAPADLVSVHSPPFMHHQHVMRALELGRNVLCDKPFGVNAAQALAMRDEAQAAGVQHFLNFETRAKPIRAKLLELIRSGAIGRPRHLSWTFFANGFRHGRHGWVNAQDEGGGWIGAYGSHCIDFMRVVFGSEVAQCGGISRTEVPMRPDRAGEMQASTAEDAYSAWFVFENGATATQDTAFCAAVSQPLAIAVLGDEGGIELTGDTRLALRRAPDLGALSAAERIRRSGLAASGDETWEFPPPPGEPHAPALLPHLEAVRDALCSGVQISPSFEDGLHVAQAMDQLRANLVRPA